jgi:hypothetical protein
MDAIAIVVLVAAFVLSAIPAKQPPAKTAEEELGEAIGKYLSKGIKIQVELKQNQE